MGSINLSCSLTVILLIQFIQKCYKNWGMMLYAWPSIKLLPIKEGIAKIRELLSLKEPCVWTFASPSSLGCFLSRRAFFAKTSPNWCYWRDYSKSCFRLCGVSVNYIPSSPSMVKLVELIIKGDAIK